MVCMDHSDASGSSTFFWFLYLFFLMKYYGSIVIFPTFSVYFVSLVLSASPFSSKLVIHCSFDFLLMYQVYRTNPTWPASFTRPFPSLRSTFSVHIVNCLKISVSPPLIPPLRKKWERKDATVMNYATCRLI